ncbi:hypothetical protein D3C76_455040 [compost metagenome]
MQLDLLAAIGDAWSVGQAEQLLQAHREDRRVFAVIKADVRAGRYRQVRGGLLLQTLRQRPGQQVAQHRRQVQCGEMAEARHLAQVGLQPVFQAGEQGLVSQVGPFAVAVLGQVQLTQQGHARLPLPQLGGPGQQVQAFAPDQPKQSASPRFVIQAGQRFAAEHQLADLDLALGAQHLLAFVPIEDIDPLDLLGQHALEQRRVELGGQIDAFFALTLAAAQVGDHQPRALH